MGKLFRVALLAFVFSVGTIEARAASAPPEGFADIIEGLSPAVVNVYTTQKIASKQIIVPELNMPDLPPGHPLNEFKDFLEQFRQAEPGAPQDRKSYSLGSGFVIDEDGYIVTNSHVIADSDEINVKFGDNREYKAKIIGKDSSTDLALLKIDAGRKLPFVKFGDSDKVRVGDWVIAIGNPFGLGGSVSAGIISARARDINAGPFDDFLQTDAAINRGNSGGPMFNLAGEVIGINTAIFSPTGGNIGIGFAVPSALAEPVIKQLKEFGKARRAWLGVKIQTVTEEIAESVGLKEAKGALVVEVTPDSPAAKAGVKSGDVILSFDGKGVDMMRHLPRMVAETAIGKKVALEILRGDKTESAQVTLGELKEESKEEADKPADDDSGQEKGGEVKLGMRLKPLTPELVKRYEVSAKQGLVVIGVEPASAAAERGVRAGDVIADVGGKAVSGIKEFDAAIKDIAKAGRKNALLRILRGEDILFITVPVGGR